MTAARQLHLDDLSTHQENLDRVSVRIGAAVRAFLTLRLAQQAPEFHMQELVAFIQARDPATAPDSASRVMRDMRQRGAIRYALLSRSQSRYRAEWVAR